MNLTASTRISGKIWETAEVVKSSRTEACGASLLYRSGEDSMRARNRRM